MGYSARKDSMPIIHIIGLPGAGKTTLANRLSKKLKYPVFKIGDYRSKYPESVIGEADAWVALFHDLSKQGWKNSILETTGLNCRESFLKTAVPTVVRIKLEAKRSVLYERIKKKRKSERGGEWFFIAEYRNKFEFVKKLFKEFQKIPAEIEIDSGKLREKEVFSRALKEIKIYSILGD